MYIVTNPGRKRSQQTDDEMQSLIAAQRMANGTRRTSTIEYVSREGRRELWTTVRPEERTGIVTKRINDRMQSLVDSGMTVEEAAHTITAENMARFTA